MHKFVVTGMIAAFCVVFGVNAYAKPDGASPSAASAEKEVTPAMVAGTYVREIEGAPGKVVVKAAGAKIDVKLEAASDFNKAKATAAGVLKFVKGVAVLSGKSKAGEWTVSLRFMGPSVVLLYNGEGFGPKGIDPSGVYRKK